MSLKNYFDKATTIKSLSNKSADEIASEVESVAYHKEDIVEEERFIPNIDFSLPENFARYGSAEEYYDQAIKRIYEDYPYDGSFREKLKWQNESTYLDLHVFDNLYPRTNGYINLSVNGSTTSGVAADGYGRPDDPEYIFFKGGPNPADNGPSPFATHFTGSNYYESALNRENNLKFDLKEKGTTVEFWLKKPGLPTADTDKEVVFDLWNNTTIGDPDYGRLRIAVDTTGGGDWLLTILSGSTGVSDQALSVDSTVASYLSDDLWHHYAFSFMSASAGINTTLYIDGTLNNTYNLGSAGINEVTGALVANIGGLVTNPDGAPAASPTATGAGKLSGSLDEFRYWKIKRTGKDIGRFWFTQVGGGTNSDPTPFLETVENVNTNLGVYYKFNEGITGDSNSDSTVLDYSGRISNGAWTGYTPAAGSRNTGSAIVESSAAIKEFLDPIIYSFHPDVVALASNLQLTGSSYDVNNNAQIYNSIPSWITEEDIEGQRHLKNLTQIMSSYFDTLHLQIESLSKLKDVTYVSGSEKPLPFAEKLLLSSGLVAPEIFIDADVLEKLADRSEDKIFEKSLHDIKNTIYKNIYNNLIYIYKSKGTEKSFRNLIRCFGIDDELIKLNMYANNTEYEIRDNRRLVSVPNKYINFNTANNTNATVYQFQDPTDTTNTTGYFPANTELTGGYAQTFEVNITFPKKLSEESSIYAQTNVISASLFGVHGTSEDESDLTWDTQDATNFQVYAVRDELLSDNVRFVLTGTAGGYVPKLVSDLYESVYDDTNWNLAVRIKPENYPLSEQVDSADTGNYVVELYGIQVDAGVQLNEFTISETITSPPAGFVTGSKRIFIGAHRTNFNGSALHNSDVRVSSCKYWFDYVENEALAGHAHDIDNYGSIQSSFYAHTFHPTADKTGEILKLDTLALNWDFSQNTGSDASGQFAVADRSSGSADLASSRFGWIGSTLSKQHTGRGDLFDASSAEPVEKDFVVSSKLQLPENVYASDMVNVLGIQEQQEFTRDSRPINYFFAFEKSMAQALSVEMINYFATLKDINTIIGAPVNRYRPNYKTLRILRQRFFERVSNNEIDFDKFYEFYKWFDSSLTLLVGQLIPASVDFSDNIRTIIESHMFERSKYQHKFQNVKQQVPKIEGHTDGAQINLEMSNSPEDDPTGTGFYSANAVGKRQIGTSQPISFNSWNLIHAPMSIIVEDPGVAKSLLFDGVDEYVDIGADTIWDPLIGGSGIAAKPYSVSFWHKPIEPTRRDTWLYSFGIRDRDVFLLGPPLPTVTTLSNSYLLATNRSNSQNFGRTATGVLTADTWHHITITFGGGTTGLTTIYVDGADATTLQDTVGDPDTIVNNSSIGADPIGGSYAGGNFCDFAVWDKELSSAEVTEIYGAGARVKLSTTTCQSNLLSWWKLGNGLGDTYNGTMDDEAGGRDGTPTNFDSSSDIEEDSPAFFSPYGTSIGNGQDKKTIWWRRRAEKQASALSSSVRAVNENKQTQLISIKNTDRRATDEPLRFGASGARALAGTGMAPSKKVDFVYQATTPFGSLRSGAPVNVMVSTGSTVEQLIDTSDIFHPAYKQRLGFGLDPEINKNSSNFKNDGNLLAPFSIYSSSVNTGYNAAVVENYASGVMITNLHHDLVYDTDVPMQTTFTEKYVGGRAHRHVALNNGSDLDTADTRPEGWKIKFEGVSSSAGGTFSKSLAIVPANYDATDPLGYNKDIPMANRLRNVGTKRPVNIRNIQMRTGSTIIGNYQKNYQIINTSGRTNNDPFFNDQSFEFAIYPETLATRGRFPLTSSTNNVGGDLDYALPARTGSTSNQTVIVNRFSSPGGYEVISRGYMDPAHEEVSVYNASPYRNLSVRDYGLSGSASADPTKANTIVVVDQIGKNRGLNQRASLHAGPFGSDAAYGSVPASTYVTTPSYHKVNRNARKRLEESESYAGEFNGTTSYVDIGTAATWEALIGGAGASAKAYSYSMWWKRTGVADIFPRLISFGDDDRQLIYYTATSFAGSLRALNNTSTSGHFVRTAPGAVSDTNIWYHVVVTYAGGSAGAFKIYVDGIDASDVNSLGLGPETIGTYNATIGGGTDGSTNNFQGNISNVAVWNRELSATEVASVYNGGKVANLLDKSFWSVNTLLNGLKGYYRFNSALGDTTSTVTNRAPSPPASTDGAGSNLSLESATGPTHVEKGSVYDNLFVQHAIPRSEQQYSWITASLEQRNTIFGFTNPSDLIITSLPLESASVAYGEGDFVGLRTLVLDPVSSSAHTLGFPLAANSLSYINSLNPAGAGLSPSRRSILFDGDNEYLNLGADTIWDPLIGGLGPSAEAYSYSFWFKPTGTNDIAPRVLSFGNSSRQVRGISTTWPSKLRALNGNTVQDGEIQSTTTINLNTWYHVVVTYSGSGVGGAHAAGDFKIYLNGVDDSTSETVATNNGGGPDAIAGNSSIGGYLGGTSNNFQGNICDVAVWDRDLAPGEVTALYGGGERVDINSTVSTNLVAWWKMGDGAGDSATGTIYDQASHVGGPYNATPVNLESGDIELDSPGSLKPPVDYLNTLLLNRNGPYGYPMWKQTRAGESPIVRKLRAGNKIGQVVPPSSIEGANGLITGLSSNKAVDYIEQPIASKAKPITFIFEDNTETSDAANNIILKTSFQNNLDYFTNMGLNNRLGLSINPDDGNAYNTIVDFTLGSGYSTIIRAEQRIYPSAENVYQPKVRTRENYDISNIWNDVRALRSLPEGAIASTGFRDPSSSFWPIDSHLDFDTTQLAAGTGSTAGELLNTYARYSAGQNSETIRWAASYVMPTRMGEDPATGKYVIMTAQPWTAPEQAGISPYQPYVDYANNLRAVGKDMTIVPEFRISEFMEEYVNNKNSDFLIKTHNMFSLTGATISDSSQQNFYRVYSTSDFMKYFKVIDDDLADQTNDADQKIKRHSIILSCEALTQFLPYKGFYPVERTQELVSLLSSSLGNMQSRDDTQASQDQRIAYQNRAFMEPLVAPGILFNTIKSGIACSNFVVTHTSSVDDPLFNLDDDPITVFPINTTTGSAGAVNLLETTLADRAPGNPDPGSVLWTGFIPAATGSSNPGFLPRLNLLDSSSAELTHGYFMHRVPFEAIRDPERYLAKSAIPGSGRIFDTGIYSSSLFFDNNTSYNESKYAWLEYSGIAKSPLYKYGIDNFLCETYNFFLRGPEASTFLSKEEESFKSLKKDKYYGMRITLGQPPEKPFQEFYNISRKFGMYSRASAYGVPAILSGTNIDGVGVDVGGGSTGALEWTTFEHVLPPSFYGQCHVDIIVKAPFDGRLSLDDIISNAVLEYDKTTQFAITPNGHASDQYKIVNYDVPGRAIVQSQIDSSIDFLEKLLVVPDNTTQQKARWMIRPKFETPILNFYNVPAERILTGSLFIGPDTDDGYFKIRGMWHQYGNKITGSEGLYVSVSELPTRMSSSNYGLIEVESLTDVVGFDAIEKRIGDFAQFKKLEEAIVCVPFLTDRGERIFFDVEKDSQEYVTQLSLLNKYVFPPTFDFLINPSVKPIAFYAFEFDATLSQDDLINIWQNLPPKLSSNFQKKQAIIRIRSLVDKLLDNDQDLQWMIFKVKRRAEKDYNVYTRASVTEEGLPIVQPALDTPYSYNWPYDYCSLVELVKINEEVVYATEDIIPEIEEEELVPPDLRKFIPPSNKISPIAAPRDVVLEISTKGTEITSAGLVKKEPAKKKVTTKSADPGKKATQKTIKVPKTVERKAATTKTANTKTTTKTANTKTTTKTTNTRTPTNTKTTNTRTPTNTKTTNTRTTTKTTNTKTRNTRTTRNTKTNKTKK